MAQNTAQAKDLLKQAIKSEIDGQRFYNYLAEKTSNDEARRKLSHLAGDEVRHEKALRQIFTRIYGEKDIALPEKGVGVLSDFFENPESREDMSERQYIDLAIEAELAATEYYKAEAARTTADDLKKIFESMAAEEYSHFELLQAEKDALSGNYYWFSFDDTSPMEE